MKKRKIGILTQPLHTNYGGLLQNYALQQVLINMGYDVETIRSKWKTNDRLYLKAIYSCKLFILKYALKRYTGPIFPYHISKEESDIISQHTDRFISQYICTTKESYQEIKASSLDQLRYDAFIIGSDQVWRPCYSPFLPNFFLDFLDEKHPAKRIAYAASFGVEDWELSTAETLVARKNIKKFDVVTVREDIAVDLCCNYLNVEATHVLDPTMLLQKEDYIKLVEAAETPVSEGSMMAYVLDRSAEKQQIIQQVSKRLNLKEFEVMPLRKLTNQKPTDIRQYIYPAVEQWLRGFMDAEFVVTDSFHGTVFSILFNKPFIAIGNKDRGLSRFTSLLKLFKLEHRLVYSLAELDRAMATSIDYTQVNAIMREQQTGSISILSSCLK